MEYWVDLAKRIEDIGASSICVKDMAGLLVPYKTTELVGALKDAVSITECKDIEPVHEPSLCSQLLQLSEGFSCH